MKPFVELKIKIVSLADESRTIRREERKIHEVWPRLDSGGRKKLSEEYQRLHYHRTIDVRRATRSSILAYGFLRGRPYAKLEAKCYEKPDLDIVLKLARKFSDAYVVIAPDEDDVRDWLKGKLVTWKPTLIDRAAE